MKKYISGGLMMAMMGICSVGLAADKPNEPKISWIIQTTSDQSPFTGSIPGDGRANIVLIPTVSVQWTCTLEEVKSNKIGKSRDLLCVHKDQAGYYDGAVFATTSCRYDGQNTVDAAAFIKLISVVPQSPNDHDSKPSMNREDITVACSVDKGTSK